MNFTRIRELREDRDLTQQQLANNIGIKRPTYSLWEAGLNTIPLKYLVSLSNYYNVNCDYILRLTNTKENYYKKDTFDIKKLGKNMKKIRLENNLTQENIAAILKISQAAVNKYEKGIIQISLLKLIKFAKEFNITIDQLIKK